MVRPYRERVSAQEVRRLFSYDPETGELLNRVNRGKKVVAGTVAGHTRPDGYRSVCVNYERILVHRLVWLLTYGAWPKGHLDHIDQNPSNNRLSNLRECNDAENAQNLSSRGYGTSGYLGVTRDSRNPARWVAKIKVKQKSTNLGTYNCKTAAYVAYCKAKAQMHTFAHGDAVNAVVKNHQ